ncbi:alpha/beta fold hydrolase [Azotobacter armeniacus]
MDRFIQANAIRLHCLDHPGGDLPLVLMPGLTANAHAFDGLVKAGLSPALRVLALDLRGRGLSDKPDSGYSMAEHAADVLGLLDALGLRQVVLGGHSFGGLLALYMAARYPERVDKLVVIDAAGSFHPQVRELIQPSLDRLGTVHPSWEAYLAAIKRMPFYAGWWDPSIESAYRADVEIRDDGTVKPRSRPEAIGEALDKLLAEDWPGHMAAVRQPMLLLNALGAYGPPGTPPVLPREQALETVAAVADGRYVEVPGNHMTMLFGEGATRTVEAILGFVRP